MRWSVAMITVSYDGSRNENQETSAQVIRELVEEELLGEIVDDRIVISELDEVMAAMIETAEYYQPALIATIGGIGLGPQDITPEATLRVIEREVPGIAEAMRRHAMMKSPHAMLTRAVCGIRSRTLIVNLPDSPQGVHEHLSAVIDQLPLAFMSINQ